jgi:hypothetical protein
LLAPHWAGWLVGAPAVFLLWIIPIALIADHARYAHGLEGRRVQMLDKDMDKTEIDRLEVLSDLQVQVGVLQRIVAILLAQYALNFDEPSEAFRQIRELLGAVSVAVPSSGPADYSERLKAEIERVFEDAALFVRQGASQSD